ncbi:uncharacterized protein [Phaseolus vulgaris]|uniref:uncharacterized protein n=1 Tax=Phaseolus vulgaris TaxID=3885 RepID=UPI0035CB7713
MVITVEIDKFAIAKVLVDQGSSVDILYCETFKKMNISESEIQPYDEQIVGFSGERVDTRGYIDLFTTFGDDYLSKTINVRYLLVNANTSYNILLGRPSINRLKAIVSTPHLAMKFPSVNGDIATVHVDQKTTRECYVANMPGVKPDVITHRLSVYEEARPVSQKKRKLGEERRKAAREETEKLVQAGFIQEAHYTTWLANVVMVKKANGK